VPFWRRRLLRSPFRCERRQPQAGGTGTRFAGFNVSSYDATARTVEAVLSAGSAVRRYYFTEELEISETAIDLSRVALGQVRLLDTHNQYSIDAVLGTVSDVRVVGSELIGVLHFADTDRGREVEARVASGELTGISIGYRVTNWQISATDDKGNETWRAVAWELLEVSLVPVPADPIAGVRSAPGNVHPGTTHEEDDMRRNLPTGAAAAAPASAAAPAPAAVEPVRAAPAAPPAPPVAAPVAVAAIARFSPTEAIDFMADASTFGVEDQARALIAQNEAGSVSPEAARSALLRAAGDQQRARTATAPATARAVPGSTNEEMSRNAIAGALVARTLRQAPDDASREYMNFRLLEIAASRAGLSPRERDPITILRAANTSSDFPLLLESAGNRVLLARYGAAEPTFRSIAAQRNLTDFKPTNLLRTGDFPSLLPYAEDGEIKAGTISEGKEAVILGSYGRILRLSRQAIVNDDLGAFDQVFGSIGRMVARFENATFYAMKAQNGGLGPKLSDGKTLFHAAHGNLAPAGADLGVDTLGAGRAAIRTQKDLDGNFLNLAPAGLLVGPTMETKSEQILSPLQPQQAGNVNPFAGRLTPQVEGSITDNSWELYANPDDLPTFVYGYLADAPGPRVISEESFSVDGMSWRVTEDFYCGAIDYRGAFRNPGTPAA
jgi:HK97 family phage prohead protease